MYKCSYLGTVNKTSLSHSPCCHYSSAKTLHFCISIASLFRFLFPSDATINSFHLLVHHSFAFLNFLLNSSSLLFMSFGDLFKYSSHLFENFNH